MTRRKVFIAFAAAVMILVLTAALFVACDQTKTYTVTFKDGETVVKTVSVKDGATIADADLPADPTKDSALFEGWFDGDKAFDKTAAITGDVTYTAKWTSLFTVTFKDGDTVIATATVKDGEKIAASDIPANLADTQDSAFEGWFNGDSAFDKDAAITASVTYNAKWTGLFNVTFMNGDTQVKSVKVKSGEKIADADIPADPAFATPEYTFGGWFNGEVEFDENATVDSNVVYTAKWNKVAYVVTFKNGDEVVKTSYIEIAEGAKLTAEDLADAATKADSVFLGYYDGIVKAAADLQVTADRTFVAEFANEETYAAGYWINTEEHKMLTIKSDKKVTYDKFSNKAFKYDAKTGTMKYSDGFGYSKVTYTITVIGDHAVITESGFEYEEPYSKDTILEKKADAGLAAFYTMGRNKQFIVEDNGIISGYGSNAFKYGWFYTETVDGKTVYHFDFIVSTTLVQKTATVDANGNYVVTGSGEASYNGIYGKDVDGITYYGDYQYIYGLVGETSTTYVYVDANKDSHYATISGELAANSIITVSYGEGKSVVFTITKAAKATADGSLKQASSERGTYNGDKGAIFLDGFGKATVDGAAYSYYINSANVVVISNETATIGVTIDTEIGVYLEKTTDGKAQIFTQSGSKYYTFELDGFGGVNYIYKSTYSSSITRGTYEFSQDGATVTIAKVNSSVNGTYNIQDSGKVLVESTSESKVFIADGYTVATHEQDFVGYYVDANGNAIEITIEDGRIWLAIAETNKQLTKNWNGTALTYTATDTDAGKGFNTSSATYTLTLVDGNVVISHDCIQSYDSISEEYVIEKKSVTYTKTEKPVPTIPTSMIGYYKGTGTAWQAETNFILKITETQVLFDERYGLASTELVANTENSVTVSFTGSGSNVVFTLENGKITISGTYYSGTLSPATEEAKPTSIPEAFIGTWIGTVDGKTYKYVFTETTVEKYEGETTTASTYNMDSLDIATDGSRVTITGDTFFEISEGKLIAKDAYSEGYYFTCECTKQAAGTLDAFAGTWSGKPFASTVEMVLDGKGSGTFAGNAITYTVKGDSIEFTCNGCACVVTKSGDKLNFTCDDAEWMADFTLTKQA